MPTNKGTFWFFLFMTTEKKYLLYTQDQDLLEVISSKLEVERSQLVLAQELKDVFDSLSKDDLDFVFFEAYHCVNEQYRGVNPTDLDILLYFAGSEDSANRHVKFLPIQYDHEECVAAETLYSELYERYLLLMPEVLIENLNPTSLEIDDNQLALFDLISTFDQAFIKLDEKIEAIARIRGGDDSSMKTTLVSGNMEDFQSDFHKVEGFIEEENDITRVSGSIEQLSDEATLVKGHKETLENQVTTVTGVSEKEDNSKTIISGDIQEDNAKTLISGSIEEDNSKTIISGDIQEDSSFTRISGQLEDEVEDLTRIISNELETGGTQLSMSSSPVEETSNVLTMKGSKEILDSGKMQVKHLEVEEKQEAIVEKTDIDMRNKNGLTPLMIFCAKGELENALSLLNQGANPSLKCKNGLTVLHYACSHSSNLPLVEKLVLEKNQKLSTRDNKGLDPLAIAIKSDASDLVKWLVANGARTNLRINGDTLLHFAVKHNALQSFLILLSTGLNTNLKSSEGINVEQLCKQRKKVAFLKALMAYNILNNKKSAA